MSKVYVVVRTDRGSEPMIYGGPHRNVREARLNRLRLEGNGSCVNPNELQARRFLTIREDRGKKMWWWDSREREI